MEKVTIFMDFANIAAGTKRVLPQSSYIYDNLLQYLGEGRFVIDAYAYVPIDPRNANARIAMIEHLQENGWMVISKMGKIAGESYKCNVDVEMTMDIMDHAHQVRPDIMVLCTGDGDFLPLVRKLRFMGIRAEVAAFRHTAAKELRQEASGFIDLDAWLQYDAGEITQDGFEVDNVEVQSVECFSSIPHAQNYTAQGGR